MKALQERIMERVVELNKKKLEPIMNTTFKSGRRKTDPKLAPLDKAFALPDGRKLKSLFELVDELETQTDEHFTQFVTPSKNDYSNWIRDVFGEKALATEIEKMQNKWDIQRAILKQMARTLKKVTGS